MAEGQVSDKQLIEALLRERDELYRRVTKAEHRLAELSNAEAMKNEFISSVSHELRTPLTAIKGWAETIYMENDPDTIHKGMAVIINETERLSRMVEELLDFSRMQSGHFTLNGCPCRARRCRPHLYG